jgi:hypothetical protein
MMKERRLAKMVFFTEELGFFAKNLEMEYAKRAREIMKASNQRREVCCAFLAQQFFVNT